MIGAVVRDASRGGFDVVIDPLFGEPLVAALGATSDGARIVNVGASAGESATIARSDLMGRTLLLFDEAWHRQAPYPHCKLVLVPEQEV